jgi:hypothetical protein
MKNITAEYPTTVSPLQKFNTCGLRIKRGEEGEKVTRNI